MGGTTASAQLLYDPSHRASPLFLDRSSSSLVAYLSLPLVVDISRSLPMMARFASLALVLALVACLAVTAFAAGRKHVQGPFIVPNDAPAELARRATRGISALHIYDTVTITWEGFDGDRTVDLSVIDLDENVLEHKMIPNSGSFTFVLGRVLPGVGVQMVLKGHDSGRVGVADLHVRLPDVYKK